MTPNYSRKLTLISFTLFPHFKRIPFVVPFPSLLTTQVTIDNPQQSSHSREQKLISLFKTCSTMMDLKQIHAQIIQTGFGQNIFVSGRIISFCTVSEDGSMDYAFSVFEQIECPDGFLRNTMIRGYGKANQPREAFLFYKRMVDKCEVPDNFTFSFLLKICGQLKALELGKQVHCSTVKHGLDSHVYVRNTLIHMYGLLHDLDNARQLFEEISRLDLVSWNTIIDSYVHCGQCNEALRLFSRMQRSGFEPDEATLVIILSACSDLGDLDFGRWVHSRINGTGLDRIISVSNSLIDMYSKCGAIDKARRAFDAMNQKNVVSWNAMILGLAMHGYADEALDVFSRMKKWEFGVPNEVTFLGVLCACSHRGMVDEGRRYFDSMRRDYHIRPTIKHYGCMVDILGRAGLVDDAYELIRSMPMDCNAIVWRALLGACRVHGNIKLGERVRRHLLELEPNHSGDYVLLANMYASAGQWNEVTRVREAMRNRGVQKPEPGNSLIEVHPTIWLESESTRKWNEAVGTIKT
ncbi:pentatricopeptide repeat-containing protein At1g59720, chloroplastic/mitochondrial-like [Magnolia sinica]|uniref:pentatricopeptide repeat-containing protein At1g59720, chloroplastic/mitochondrial-like n=1 Tax=Magnolia sinica TaxID=86752 RepID=UPI00265A08FC|nr:pentatricopeptide repeat-containing protein At1g59720, chloroplastic/mitochondrial-like [Magnolia sinica]